MASRKRKTPSPPIQYFRDPNADLPVPLVLATRDAVKVHLKSFGLAEVIKVATIAVEQYTAMLPKKTPGASKLELCKQVLPFVIQAAVEEGMIEALPAMRLQARIDSGLDVIEDFINAFVAISKNPQFIQFREEITEKCCTKKTKKSV
jgi:hypothetical protein